MRGVKERSVVLRWMDGVALCHMRLGSRNAASADRFVTVRRICAEDLKCLGFVLFLSDAQYITCKMQNCSEATRNKPFPGYIDHNSLIVQDDYVFVQVQDTLFSYLFCYFILYCSVLHYFLFHSFLCMCMCISSQLIRQYWIQIIKAECIVAVPYNANSVPFTSSILWLQGHSVPAWSIHHMYWSAMPLPPISSAP